MRSLAPRGMHLGKSLSLALCAIGILASCTQDNVHMPEGGVEMEGWDTTTVSYSGVLSTTVPLVQEYMHGPVVLPMTVRMGEFHPSHSTYVTVSTEAFSVNDPFVVDLLSKAIDIGAMEIQNVEYAAFPTGGGYLKKEAFDIQAGDYRTRGSLQGELSAEGYLTLTLTYRPGTMPFDIVSVFVNEEL